MTALTLRNMVDVEVLQEIQNRFSDATGLAVIIGDEQGRPITTPSNFTSFCTYIRSCSEGYTRCIFSDEKVGILAAQEKRPIIHRCHSGLVDLAAPIVYNDQYLGSILCGQVLMTEQEAEQVGAVMNRVGDLPLDEATLLTFLQQVSRQDEKKISAIAELLFITANYIIKMIATHSMQQELTEKTNKLMEEFRLRAELEKTLQNVELKMLQSQMNPHFLFNTLNAISRLAYVEGAEQTQEVTYSLSRILRYNLRKIGKLVPLEEELEYIHHYLFIQKTRYRDRLRFQSYIDPELERMMIPLLTLQPLIENAIIHGFEPEGKPMVIRVKGKHTGAAVCFTIEDNGQGIPADRFTEIMAIVRGESRDHTTGIGLYNIHRRLRYEFGGDYGITDIESELGNGVKITLTLPGGKLDESADCGR